jgi:hypothetical protein
VSCHAQIEPLTCVLCACTRHTAPQEHRNLNWRQVLVTGRHSIPLWPCFVSSASLSVAVRIQSPFDHSVTSGHLDRTKARTQ